MSLLFDDELIQTTKSPPHVGSTVKAKVLSVYDADTVSVVYNINENLNCPFLINVRLNNIDAPEKKTKNLLEAKASTLLTKCVTDIIQNKIIDLHIKSWDKYGGRIVGSIMLENEFEGLSMSDWLLKYNLVKSFDGKNKKEEWTNEELQKIINFFENV